MNAAAHLADEYLKGVADLRAAVAGMTPDQMAARPVPGRWSTLEVLCHLADFEPVFADRMKRVIALGDNPSLLAADENLFARELRYQDRDAAEELAVVEAVRRQMARILRGLPAEAFRRTGTHSLKGPQTLEQVVRTAINHVNHHLPFIAEKRKALGN
jgi:uncharacterized damage-inducible protein DinB